MMPNFYQHEIIVESIHLDEMNHVNNVVYLQWVQDVAKAHWESKASVEVLQKYQWVVLRHEIDYKGAAFLNDQINIKTWVEGYHGVKSTRMVEFYKDEKLLVQAKTIWCLISSSSGRPCRVGEDILSLF